MLSIKLSAASYRLAARLEPAKCERIINEQGIKRSTLLDYVYPNNVKIATAHMRLTAFKDLRALIREYCRLIDSAVQSGAHLILFPHLTGLAPITVEKGSCQIAGRFISDLFAGKLSDTALRQHFELLIDRFSDFLFDCYYNLFLLLAHKYNIYIAAGSTYIASSRGVFCRSYLFSPDQDEAFFQDKIHLNPIERKLGLLAGNELKVFDLKIGKTAFLTDADSTFFECFKVSKSLGAQIILTPALCSEVLSHNAACNPSLTHAQHHNLITVRSSYISKGDIFPKFSGASGIYAPFSMTKGLDGILMHTIEGVEDNCVLTARVDPPKLPENLDVYCYSTNSAFCENMMNNIYPAYFKNHFPAPDSFN